MAKFENLTPHAINVYRADDVEAVGACYQLRADGDQLEPLPAMIIPASGVVARAQVEEKDKGAIDGVPLFCMEYGAPVGLPEPVQGTFLIVSALTAQAAARAGRVTMDLLIPARLVRDGQGKVVGCLGFSVVEGGASA